MSIIKNRIIIKDRKTEIIYKKKRVTKRVISNKSIEK